MSYPAAGRIYRNNYAQGVPTSRYPIRPCLRRRGAFRRTRLLIIRRHFIIGPADPSRVWAGTVPGVYRAAAAPAHSCDPMTVPGAGPPPNS